MRRFIPAGAGNRRCSSSGRPRPPVHPRGCREQYTAAIARCTVRGSSPRVRGTGRNHRLRGGRIRFIPAGAGNRGCQTGPQSRCSVHPRGCGEQTEIRRACFVAAGSSPRVRATGCPQPRQSRRWRFVPAGAGNSRGQPRTCPRTPVHPRGCGEQHDAHPGRPDHRGSSPRVRGTDVQLPQDWHPGRFIPAGAGNRFRPLQRQGRRPVHPRGCGEQARPSSVSGSSRGSSPRVRGTVHSVGLSCGEVRFIPAGAGNRHHRSTRSHSCPVHPRGCGEQSICSMMPARRAGSSPRVRGTADDQPRRVGRQRFIPAGAGNSVCATMSPP